MNISSLARRCALAGLASFSLALCSKLSAAPVEVEPDWNAGGTLHIDRSIDNEQDITLQQPLSLNIDGGHTVRLRGLITSPLPGLHSLNKDGAGRLELWGENTNLKKYVRLRAGTLHVAGRYALGDDIWARLHVHPGTTLSYEAGAVVAATLLLENDLTHLPGPEQDPAAIQWRVDHGTASHIGPIHGSTPMIKQGEGTLWLRDANNSPNSRLSVAQGAVQLDSLFAGQIEVRRDARLTGNGRAGMLTVAAGGILAPLGRISVDHALSFQPDSRLHIRAWADGRHDRVHVLYGGATLDGQVIVLPQGQADDWQAPVEAVIVQTRDGLGDSRFASVESALPYLEPELHYDANDVTLLLRPRKSLPALPQGVASGWAVSLRNQLIEDSRFVREAIYSRAQAGRADGPTRHTVLSGQGEHYNAPADHPFLARYPFWVQAFHSSSRHRAEGDNHALNREINGLFLGLESEPVPRWRIGIYGGASRTQAGTPSSNVATNASARADSMHLGLYAHHDTAWGSLFTVGVAQSRHHLRSHRTASTSALRDNLDSRYRARTSQMFAQLKHPLWVSADRDTILSPFARLAWVHTRQAAHTERGGALALHLPSDRTTVLFSTLGLNIEQKLTLPRGDVTVSGAVAWRHASGDTQAPMRQTFRDDVQQNRLYALGTPVLRHAWNLNLGIDAPISKRARLDLHYAGQYGKRVQDHGVRLGMVVQW